MLKLEDIKPNSLVSGIEPGSVVRVVAAERAGDEASLGVNRQGKGLKAQSKAAVRASISFPPDLYGTLEEIAQHKKVSLAWVVRDAAEKYVAESSKPGNATPRT